MRLSRIVGILLAVALAPAALSGCGLLNTVEAKTNTIVGELDGMPGIVDATVSAHELGLNRPRYSAVWVELDPSVTEAEVLDILTVFAGANQRTGVDDVSSILNLVIPHESRIDTDRVRLHHAAVTPQQLAGTARAWSQLRQHFEGADVELGQGRLDLPEGAFEVSIGMPDGASAADRLDAVRHVRDLFDDIGVVTKIFPVGGGFEVRHGLPSEAALSLVQSIIETDGILSARGQFWGEEFARVTVSVSDAAGLVDHAIGVPRLMAEVVDLIPRDAPAISLTFDVGDGDAWTVTFDNEACRDHGAGMSAAASQALLSYWARDGRTLLDGSSAASCS